jgi:Methane oxygenase PmoA
MLRMSLLFILSAMWFFNPLAAQDSTPELQPVPVPRMQVLPLPRHEVSLTDNGQELTRYFHHPQEKRTFLYPIIGPSGRSLTRMGHPQDPNGHSHHNSVWISHMQVNGVDFWADTGKGKIVQQRVVRYGDSDTEGLIQVELHWVNESTQEILLKEFRSMRVLPLENKEWLLCLDLEFATPGDEPVTLGETAFGFIGVRMAKTIGVRDGGGMLRNAEGLVNEKAMFRKPTAWVDYSGLIAPGVSEGLTLFDHAENFSHPTPFHVRDDGWMGASPTFAAAKTIEPKTPLVLRYGLYVHNGIPKIETIAQQYTAYCKLPPAPPRPVKK